MSADAIYQRSPRWVQTLLLNAHAVGISRHRYGPPFRASVKQLLDSESWSRDRLEAYQDERIRTIVRLAYERSPYYRETMRQTGAEPGDIRGRQDLNKLEIITKDIVRDSGHQMLTARRPLRGWLHGHTSGTTGSPLSLWYSRNMCIINNAVDQRQKIWGGLADGDWLGVLLGRVVVPPAQVKPPFWRTNRVHRQVWFSAFHLSEENLAAYVAEIKRRKLRFLEGYPSTLFILAQYVLRRGISLPMRAVFSSSETLHRVQRETIEAAFGCEPFDFYGHAERVIFATECEEHDGKHLAEEYGYTEVVDENGQPLPDGQRGFLVGTSLHNEALPLLRYRTGDISSIRREPCACGRTLIRIEDVSTKAEDIVVTPDGRMISPSVLTHPFKPFPQIVKSQLIQERTDHLLVKIVPSAELTPENQRELRDQLALRLGAGVDIDVQLVDDIPQEPSGKFRWVISRVDHLCRFSWDDQQTG